MDIADLRFLVAEDHGFQRRAIIGMLNNLGAVHVVGAEDGNAALTAFREQSGKIDIVVTDLDMPGMDGMELLRHISGSGRPVSIIVTSAIDRAVMASVEVMLKAYGATLLGAIEKPVTVAKLADAIRKHEPPMFEPSFADAGFAFSADEIRSGLQAGQLDAVYQPRVAIGDAQVDSVQALPHWRHPERGSLTAQSVAELTGDAAAIDELTWALLEKSAQQRREWMDDGLPIELAVSLHLPLASLSGAGAADRITAIVRDCGIEPGHFIFEMTKDTLDQTEAASAKDSAGVLETLARLRMRGFRLCISDYGTGSSSLDQLTRIAFTDLKIHRSFVTGAVGQNASWIVLQSSIEMARRLRMRSIADGVETREQWEMLAELGCNLAQGYFVARPMAAWDFVEWYRRRSTTTWWKG